MSGLEVSIAHRLGDFALDVRFASDARLTALFGRSGAGKTSVLHAMSGLIRPAEARIVVDGEVLHDSARGVFVPAHRRRVGYVFQDARLFPHLDVRRNLLYGRWLAPRAQRRARVDDVVDLLGLAPLLTRRTPGLSGGERQRVAIGRALLAEPRLLLLDEPLASVDHARRDEVLTFIERLRDELRLPIVYVSHEPLEVARLAGSAVLLADGRVVTCGAVGDVLSHAGVALSPGDEPLTVLDAIVVAHEDAWGLTAVAAAGATLHVPRVDLAPGATLRLLIRARDVMLATHLPTGISAQNLLRGEIAALQPGEDHSVDVVLACAGVPLIARVTARAADALGLRVGLPLHALVKSVAIARSARALPEAASR